MSSDENSLPGTQCRYVCGIAGCTKEYAVKPRAVNCSHIFCKDCIRGCIKSQQSDEAKCPLCQSLITSRGIRKPNKDSSNKNHYSFKAVEAVDRDSGQVVHTYSSASDASITLNLSLSQVLAACKAFRKDRSEHANYIWRFQKKDLARRQLHISDKVMVQDSYESKNSKKDIGKDDKSVSENDVVLQSGYQLLAGNAYYLSLIRGNCVDYMTAGNDITALDMKNSIVSDVIDCIKKKGGRFVKIRPRFSIVPSDKVTKSVKEALANSYYRPSKQIQRTSKERLSVTDDKTEAEDSEDSEKGVTPCDKDLLFGRGVRKRPTNQAYSEMIKEHHKDFASRKDPSAIIHKVIDTFRNQGARFFSRSVTTGYVWRVMSNEELVTKVTTSFNNYTKGGDLVVDNKSDCEENYSCSKDEVSKGNDASKDVIYPCEKDLLFGVGVGQRKSNQMYLKLVKRHCKKFVDRKDPSDESIIHEIIDIFKKKGARFLVRSQRTKNEWRVLEDSDLVAKVRGSFNHSYPSNQESQSKSTTRVAASKTGGISDNLPLSQSRPRRSTQQVGWKILDSLEEEGTPKKLGFEHSRRPERAAAIISPPIDETTKKRKKRQLSKKDSTVVKSDIRLNQSDGDTSISPPKKKLKTNKNSNDEGANSFMLRDTTITPEVVDCCILLLRKLYGDGKITEEEKRFLQADVFSQHERNDGTNVLYIFNTFFRHGFDEEFESDFVHHCKEKCNKYMID